jgi:hypothetical protein
MIWLQMILLTLFTLEASAQSLPKLWPTPTPSERQRMAGELGLGPGARRPTPTEWQRKMKELGMGVAGSGVGASTAGPNPMDLCEGVVRADASDVHGRNLTQTLNQESACNVSGAQPQVDQFRNLVESVRAAQTRELAQELRSQDFRDSIFAFWSAHERMRGKLANADEALSQLMSGWDTWMRKSRREYTSQNEAMILKGALLKYWNQYQALPARRSFTRWTDADWAKKVTEFNATQKEAHTLCSQIYHESEQARAASERSGGDPYYERNRQQDRSAQAYQANTKQVRVRAFSVLKKELEIKYQEKIEALNARISDSAGAILFTQEPNRKSYPPIHLDQCMNEGRSVPSLTTDKLKSEIDPFFTAIREKVFEAQYSLVEGPDSADIRRLLATDPALIVKWLDQNKSNPQRVAILCSQILELYERDEIRNYFKVAGQVVAGTAGLVLMATGVGAALGAPLAMGATLTGALTATTYFGSTVATAAMVSEASIATSEMAGLENSLASRPEGSGITARSLRQADERSAVANAELKEDLIWTWAPEAGIGALGSLRKLKGVASQDSGLEAFAKSLDEAHPNLSPVERKVLIERVAKAETKALTSEWLKTNIAEIKSAQRPKVAGVRTTPQTTEPVPALPSRRVSPNERMDGGMTWDFNPVAPEPIRLEALPEGSSSVRITDANRSETASELLGRSLSESESAALQEAHEVGRGQAGKDPTRSASIGNYTSEQLRAKTKILRKAGFSDAEASVLLRKGLAGDDPLNGVPVPNEYFNKLSAKQLDFRKTFVSIEDANGQEVLYQMLSKEKDHLLLRNLSNGKLEQIPAAELGQVMLSKASRDHFDALNRQMRQEIKDGKQPLVAGFNDKGKAFAFRIVGTLTDAKGNQFFKYRDILNYEGHFPMDRLKSAALIRDTSIWDQDLLKFRERFEMAVDGGYRPYATYLDDSGKPVFVKIEGYRIRDGNKIPVVREPDGTMRELTPEESNQAMMSRSGDFMARVAGDKNQYRNPEIVKKNSASKNGVLMKPSGSGKVELDGYPGLYLGDPAGGDAPSEIMARAVQQKMGVYGVQSSGLNNKRGSIGFFSREYKFKINGNDKEASVINYSSLEGEGHVSNTAIHEIGHAKTKQNIREGRIDPGAIQFKGDLRKSNTTVYKTFMQADEIRQHSRDVGLILRNRHEAEIQRAFKEKGKLSVEEAFGSNPQNFIEATDSALWKVSMLKDMNERVRNFNELAKSQVLKRGASLLQSGRHITYFVPVPYQGKNITVSIPVSKDIEQLPLGPEKTRLIQEHCIQYLDAGIEMANKQRPEIESVEKIIDHMKLNPHEEITVEQYSSWKAAISRLHTTTKIPPKP